MKRMRLKERFLNSRIVKRIGDIGVVVGGATPSTKVKHYWDGRIPWLSPKDLTGYKKRYISLRGQVHYRRRFEKLLHTIGSSRDCPF